MVERFKLDVGIENMLRTAMAPEDAVELLRDPALKLDQARNPSSLLVNYAKPHIKRAKADRCVALVPMLKWIDRLRDSWQLDAEAEALLKFMVPCTRVLHWLEQIGNELPRSGSPCSFVKARLRALLAEPSDAREARPGPPPRRGPDERSRSPDSRDPKRLRRGPVASGSPPQREAPRPGEGKGCGKGGGCRGESKGGRGSGIGSPSTDPTALMAQIQRLQQELNSAKRGYE